MTFINGRTQFLEPFGNIRKPHVGAGDGVTEREKNLGDAAHADAADADEMDALEVAEGDHHGFALARLPCTFAASSIRFTISRVA